MKGLQNIKQNEWKDNHTGSHSPVKFQALVKSMDDPKNSGKGKIVR